MVRRRRSDAEWTVEFRGEVVEPVGVLWRRPLDKGEPQAPDHACLPFRPFKPYRYGQSPLHLRPRVPFGPFSAEDQVLPDELTDALPDPAEEERRERNRVARVKAKAKREREAREADEHRTAREARVREHEERQRAADEAARKQARKQRKLRKRRHLEAVPDLPVDELEQKLETLLNTPLGPEEPPLFVQAFVCSACDPVSPMFTATHWRCLGGDCACYGQTQELHDENKRLMT